MPSHKLKFEDGKFVIVGNNETADFWINGLGWSVAEAEEVGYPGEYITVAAQYQGVGNFEVVTVDGMVYEEFASTKAKPTVELSYNVVPAMPVSSYGMLLKDRNAFCLWDYDNDAFNSVYEALRDGGYEAGFEQFKKTAKFYDYDKPQPKQRRCEDDDIIGMVKLNRKIDGQWQGWPGWTKEEPSIVTLGDEEDGWPWALDQYTTIAGGGDFAFAEFVISDDPYALLTLPQGVYPGFFSGMALHIPKGYDPGPKAVGIDEPPIEDVMEFYGSAVVITGSGILRIYDIQGRLFNEIAVSGKTSIDLRPYRNTAMYILNYTNDKGSFSKKVVGVEQ
jgi:hypothetical protein